MQSLWSSGRARLSSTAGRPLRSGRRGRQAHPDHASQEPKVRLVRRGDAELMIRTMHRMEEMKVAQVRNRMGRRIYIVEDMFMSSDDVLDILASLHAIMGVVWARRIVAA